MAIRIAHKLYTYVEHMHNELAVREGLAFGYKHDNSRVYRTLEATRPGNLNEPLELAVEGNFNGEYHESFCAWLLKRPRTLKMLYQPYVCVSVSIEHIHLYPPSIHVCIVK